MAKYSDIAILEGLRTADPKIISYLWDKFAPNLQYFAENLIRDRHEAEEIISTVYMKLRNAGSKFESLEHVKSFLYMSAKHKCVDYLRRRQVDQKRLLHYESHLSETAESEDAEAERMFIKAELIHAIYKEMEKLPKNCRQIFELTYQEGLNARQISDKLGIAVTTVTTQRSRAIKFLRKVLSHRAFVTLLILLSIP